MQFQTSFWTPDYTSGLEVLFRALHTGFQENNEVSALISQKIDAEQHFATELRHVAHQATPRGDSGFAKSSSTALKSVFETNITEIGVQGDVHAQIVDQLTSRVLEPFESWAQSHVKRVTACEDRLKARVSGYQKRLAATSRARQAYSDRHQREVSRLGTPDRLEPVVSTIRVLRERYISTQQPSLDIILQSWDSSKLPFAGIEYSKAEILKLLGQLIRDVTVTSYKVTLLGNYQNVSSGANIAAATRRLLKNDSIAYSEKFGQSLVDHGVLKPVNQLSNRFHSSAGSYFQWHPMVFDLEPPGAQSPQMTDLRISETSPASAAASGDTPLETTNDLPVAPITQDARSQNPPVTPLLSVPAEGDIFGATSPDIPLSPELITESERYLQNVLELDAYRTDMEVEIMDILEYLEKCELDRVTVVKDTLHDFALLAHNQQAAGQSQHRLLEAVDSISAKSTVQSIIASNMTGPFVPNVTAYETANSGIRQTYGVSVTQSKFFVLAALDYVEQKGTNISAWITPYNLREVYKLRAQVNTGRKFNAESVLGYFNIDTVVGAIKQYLLELPESLVPSTLYDEVKVVFEDWHDLLSIDSSGSKSKEELADSVRSAKIAAILEIIPISHILVLEKLVATLRALDSPEELAKSMAFYVLRPRAASAITQKDKHPEKLLLALITSPELLDSLDHTIVSKPLLRSADLPSTPRRVVSSPIARSPHSHIHNPSFTSTPHREVPNGTSLIPLSIGSDNHEKISNRSLSRHEQPNFNRGLGILPIGERPVSQRVKSMSQASSPALAPKSPTPPSR